MGHANKTEHMKNSLTPLADGPGNSQSYFLSSELYHGSKLSYQLLKLSCQGQQAPFIRKQIYNTDTTNTGHWKGREFGGVCVLLKTTQSKL